jgi:hypothetical protein
MAKQTPIDGQHMSDETRCLIAAALTRASKGNELASDASLDAGSHDVDFTVRVVGTIEQGAATSETKKLITVDDLLAAHLIQQGLSDATSIREHFAKLAREVKALRAKKKSSAQLDRAVKDIKSALGKVAKELKLEHKKPKAGALKGDPRVEVLEINAQ